MNKQQLQVTGLVCIIIGVILLVAVGGTLLIQLGALALGLWLVNYGLQLQGYPSLILFLGKAIHEIRTRFF